MTLYNVLSKNDIELFAMHETAAGESEGSEEGSLRTHFSFPSC